MYNWMLWLHIISFISWFAALFYLPRLFVYHAEHSDNEGFVSVAQIMEHKLFRYIGVPAFWATLISGAALAYLYGSSIMQSGWFHAKIMLVLILIAYFFSLNYYRKKLEANPAIKSGKFFRIYNEVPTLLMLGIVFLVIFKPF